MARDVCLHMPPRLRQDGRAASGGFMDGRRVGVFFGEDLLHRLVLVGGGLAGFEARAEGRGAAREGTRARAHAGFIGHEGGRVERVDRHL